MTYPGVTTFPGITLFPSGAGPPVFGTPKLITLGGFAFQDSVGVKFRSMRIDGWDGRTGSSLQLTQKPRQPGAWRSRSPQKTPRTIVISGTVVTDTTDLMLDVIDDINQVCTDEESLLSVDQHGFVRTAMVSNQADVVTTQYPSPLIKGFSVQLVAADPRKFGTALTGSTFLPATTGGFTFPFTFPFTFNSTVISGGLSLTNPGNISGPVLLRVDGPVTGPVITHVGTGAALVFASSLSIVAGNWLDIDMENHTVLENGQSSRAGWVTQRGWSQFEPGVNVWAFTALSYNPASKLTATATPAWA